MLALVFKYKIYIYFIFLYGSLVHGGRQKFKHLLIYKLKEKVLTVIFSKENQRRWEQRLLKQEAWLKIFVLS